MNALVRSHTPAGIRFLAVYISEAHSRDQWPVGKTISCVDQPKTMEERLHNAREFRKNFQLEVPLLVDGMENTFHHTYGSWPFRFFVLHQGELVLKAQPDENTFGYDLGQLDQWIDNYSS